MVKKRVEDKSHSTNAAKPLVVAFASSDVNESEEYALISTNADARVTEVRLYEETIQHVKLEHAGLFPAEFSPEFPSIVGAVGKAVREPTRKKDSYGNSLIFFDDTSTNAKGHPMTVAVKIIENTTAGRVKTFFFGKEEDSDDE